MGGAKIAGILIISLARKWRYGKQNHPHQRSNTYAYYSLLKQENLTWGGMDTFQFKILRTYLYRFPILSFFTLLDYMLLLVIYSFVFFDIFVKKLFLLSTWSQNVYIYTRFHLSVYTKNCTQVYVQDVLGKMVYLDNLHDTSCVCKCTKLKNKNN